MQKEWHFAHQSRNIEEATQRECDYSFAVSVRLMIRQLSKSGLRLRTPQFDGAIQAYSDFAVRVHKEEYVITTQSVVDLEGVSVGASFSGVEVDVLGYAKGVPLAIYITYKGRSIPEELKHPSLERAGVIQMEIEGLAKAFAEERAGRYILVLKRHIEETLEGKSWVYHPRMNTVIAQAEARMSYWLDNQRKGSPHLPAALTQDDSGPANGGKSNPCIKAKDLDFECVMCHTKWRGISRECKKCGTHLFTREVPHLSGALDGELQKRGSGAK